MGKLELFKEFVKKNPSLLKHVNDKSMTWQSFFELYDLYGETDSVWDQYITRSEEINVANAAIPAGLGIADIFNWFKGMDLDAMQEGLNSVSRVLGVLQDLGGKESTVSKPEYKPRPLYKHFED